MRPTEILRNEHSLIRQALDSLEIASQKMEEGENPPREFFEKAVEFARSFVDKFHHFKEEELMFRQLALKKQSELDGQIDVLRHQHERGREYISLIAQSLEGYEKGKDAQITDVLSSLASYISLLRRHIHREDHIFYPLVDSELSSREQEELAALFVEEEKRLGAETVHHCRHLAAELGGWL